MTLPVLGAIRKQKTKNQKRRGDRGEENVRKKCQAISRTKRLFELPMRLKFSEDYKQEDYLKCNTKSKFSSKEFH